MSDHFTEYEHEGWGSNIGNSFSNMLFGFVLFLGSFVVHWWNEGRAVDRYVTLETGAKNVIETKNFSPKNDGKLVHVTGMLELDTPATDKSFNIKNGKAVVVKRRVEMYQWEEETRTTKRKKLGGGTEKKTEYTYNKIWSDRAINSSSFRHKQGHSNPSTKEPSKSFYAKDVTVKGYSLNDGQIGKLDNYKSMSIPKGATVPAKMQPKSKIGSSYIFISRNGGTSLGSPGVGDYRISFQYLPVSDVSVVGKQHNGGFTEYKTKTGDLLEVREGVMKADEVFKAAADDNARLTWILRAVGLACMAFGLAMCASPITALFNVIPFLGSMIGAVSGFFAIIIAIALSAITIAVAWFAHRPMLSFGLIGGGVAVWLLIRLTQKSPTRARAR